ncbi:MAG: hypothetical protein K2X29_12120 [Candidatus Obscuribacterales bacterium]|nr:hypothetical protein [Candidatus Obscuribacterales bacterium]
MFKWVKAILMVVITAYVVSAFIVASPESSFRNWYASAVKPFLHYFGLYNTFAPFSPDPPQRNEKFDAIVRIDDGTTKTWTNLTAQNSTEVGGVVTHSVDRWRQMLWPVYWSSVTTTQEQLVDAARFVAKLFDNGRNRPVEVRLFKEEIPIVFPTGVVDKVPTMPPKRVELIRYRVAPEDLK